MQRKLVRIGLLLTLGLSFSLACGMLSGGIPGMPDFSATETQDAIVNAATPASPDSGDWRAAFDSGEAVFHIARDGSHINSIDLRLSGWQCGGTTLSTNMEVRSPDWTIDGNQFSATIDLNPPHVEELTFEGSFDQANQTWSGTWDGDEYGTHCSGDWAATR